MVDHDLNSSRTDLEKTFAVTLAVIRNQRDANADAVVQLSVQLSLLTDINAAQNNTIQQLQHERDAALDKYHQEHAARVAAEHATVTRQRYQNDPGPPGDVSGTG